MGSKPEAWFLGFLLVSWGDDMRSPLSAALVVCLAWIASALLSTASHADDKMAEFLRQGYLANREAFRQFTCRFRVIDGTAESFSDAIAGTMATTQVRQGLWVVDGRKQRYELVCEDPTTEKLPPPPKGGGVVGGGCNTERLLSDGKLGLRYSKGLGAANISPAKGQQPQIHLTPISMGLMGDDESRGPGSATVMGVNGPAYRRFGGIRTVNGVDLSVMSIGEEGIPGNEWSMQWCLDPARGFLPLEVSYYEAPNQRGRLAVITAVRKCSNGAFFPERSVGIIQPDGPWPRGVQVIELVDLDLRTPSDNAFAVEIPKGSKVVYPEDMRAFVRVPDETRIHVSELAEWIERCNSAMKVRTAQVIPAPSAQARIWEWVVVGLAGAIAFVCAAALLRRRLRRA